MLESEEKEFQISLTKPELVVIEILLNGWAIPSVLEDIPKKIILKLSQIEGYE